MKKFAAIALALSLVATSASAVVIDATIQGVVQRINCGPNAISLESLALSEVQKNACRQVFQQAATGTGTGAGAGAGAAGFGLGAGGAAALAALGILLVAGLGGGGSGEESVSTSATTTVD